MLPFFVKLSMAEPKASIGMQPKELTSQSKIPLENKIYLGTYIYAQIST
jgi:hypothetical protein